MEPVSIEVDGRYSAPDGTAPAWTEIEAALREAEVYALTTVMEDGSPHTVPVAGIWTEDGFVFCTGEMEQKVKNLNASPKASLHIGSNEFMTGMDVIARGEFEKVTDKASLENLAEGLHGKYPEFFHFTVTDGALLNAHDNRALVFRIKPDVVHVFTRGENTVQARYRFK